MSLNVVYPIYTSPATGLTQVQKSFEKVAQSIAAGIQAKINPADAYVAAGLDTSIRSAKSAIANAQMGYNFVATADTALANINQSFCHFL